MGQGGSRLQAEGLSHQRMAPLGRWALLRVLGVGSAEGGECEVPKQGGQVGAGAERGWDGDDLEGGAGRRASPQKR